jgi:hypothetical protein
MHSLRKAHLFAADRLAVVLGALALLGGAPGCSSSSASCVAQGTVTVTVTNEDVDSDTNFICNATVTIGSASGGAPQPLTPQGLDGSNVNCTYVVNVAPGSYTLVATAAGFTTLSQSIVIEQANCVTASPTFRMTLFQNPASTVDAGSANVIREAGGPD